MPQSQVIADLSTSPALTGPYPVNNSPSVATPPPPPGVQFTDTPPPPPPGVSFKDTGSDKTVGGFVNNLGTSAENFYGGVAHAVAHPIDTLVGLSKLGLGMIANSNPHTAEEFPESSAVARAFADQYKDRYGSWEDVKNTMYNDPVGFAADASAVLDAAGGAAKALKIAAETGGAARTADILGRVGETAHDVAGAINPITAPVKAASAVVGAGAGALMNQTMNRITPNLTPAEQDAMEAASNAGVPLDAANATGNKTLSGTKAILQRQPLSAKPLAEFSNNQQAALANWGGDLSDQISPVAQGGTASRVATGTNLVDRFRDAIDSTNAFADTAYDRLRKIAANNAKTIQVGTQSSPLVGPTGSAITTPVMQTIEGPTNYAAAKAALQPIADSIEKTIPANQLQLSPGYSVLKQILARPDTVSMDTAIQDLSSVQNIARGNGEIPQLRSQSQGIAAKATQVLRGAVDQAAQDMGPDAVSALQQGRELTRQKYALRDTLSGLKNEPVQAISTLVQPQDRSIAALNQVAQQVPDMVPDIARSVVQDIIDKSATRPGGAWTAWQNLGPQTKQILFAHDPSLQSQLDNFFTAAKMIGENPNPSGSATVGGLLASGMYVIHNPVTGAAILIGQKRLANLLTDPATVARLNQGLQMPLSSKGAAATFSKILPLARGARVGLTTAARQQEQNPNEPMPLLPPQ